MMDKLPVIDSMGYHYYFQFTLTPYGRDLERNLREKNEIVSTFQRLSRYLNKDRVIWRYDPILLNNDLTIDYHTDRFKELCRELVGYTDICIISFVDIYGKLSKQVKNNFVKNITEDEMHRLAYIFFEIAKDFGIELRACCEVADLSMEGVKPAACIDKNIVEQVCGHTVLLKKDKNQRSECGCVQSVDIGVYNTCKNGCVYCYANHSDVSIQNNYLKHNPNSNILIGEVEKKYGQ
jgi:hypothetical protein